MDSHDPLVTTLLNVLRTLRNNQHLTLEELADRAGLHRTTIGLLERHERTPSVGVASQLANALGYPLSELLAKSELIVSGKLAEVDLFKESFQRSLVDRSKLRNTDFFESFTSLHPNTLIQAIQGTYHTLDMIDDQLLSRGSPPISGLVELANLSSMIGNLIGGCLADASDGLYQRNKPHSYPDLLPIKYPARPLELKVALETNKPKGHLPKPGRYITFRYVLGERNGNFIRGKNERRQTVWIWEVRVGNIEEADFSISNTSGDSGKTAVIKTDIFNNMKLVFFDPAFCPHPLKNGTYPGFN